MKITPLVLDLQNVLPLPQAQELGRMWIVKGFFYAFILNNYETYKKDLNKKILDIAQKHNIPYKGSKEEDQVNFLRNVISKMLNYSIAKSGAAVNRYFRVRKALDNTDLHTITNQDFINFVSVQAANFIVEAFKAPPVIMDEIELKGLKAVEGKKLSDALVILINMHNQFDYFYQAAMKCTILDPSTNNVQNLVDYIVETNTRAYIFDGIFGYELFIESLFSMKAKYKEAQDLTKKRIERLIAGRDKRTQEAYRQAVREANYELKRMAESAISTVSSPIKSILQEHPLGRIMLNMTTFGFKQFYLRTNKLFGLGGKKSYGPFEEGSTYYDPLGGSYKAETRRDARMMNELKKAWDIVYKYVPDKRISNELVQEYVKLNAKYFGKPQELKDKIPLLIQQYVPDALQDQKKMKQLVNALHTIYVYKSKLNTRSMSADIFDPISNEEIDEETDEDLIYTRNRLGLSKYAESDYDDYSSGYDDTNMVLSGALGRSGPIPSMPVQTGSRDPGIGRIQEEGADIVTQLANQQQSQQVPPQSTQPPQRQMQTPSVKGVGTTTRTASQQPMTPQYVQPPRGAAQIPQTPVPGMDLIKALYEALGALFNQGQQSQPTGQNNVINNITNNFFGYPSIVKEIEEEQDKKEQEKEQEEREKEEEREEKQKEREEEKQKSKEQKQKEIEQKQQQQDQNKPDTQKRMSEAKQQKAQSKLPSRLPDTDMTSQMQPRLGEKRLRKRVRKRFGQGASELDEQLDRGKIRSIADKVRKSRMGRAVSGAGKAAQVARGVSRASRAVRALGAASRALRGVGAAVRTGLTVARVGGIASSLGGLSGGAGILGTLSSLLGPIMAGIGLVVGATGAFSIGKALYKGLYKQITGQKSFEFVGERKQDVDKKMTDFDPDKVDKDKIPTISNIKSGSFKLPSVTSSGQKFTSMLKSSTGFTYSTSPRTLTSNLTDTTVKTQVSAQQPLPTTTPVKPEDYDESLKKGATPAQTTQPTTAPSATSAPAPQARSQSTGDTQDAAKQIADTANQAALQHMSAQAQLNATMAQHIEELTNKVMQLQTKTSTDLAHQMRA